MDRLIEQLSKAGRWDGRARPWLDLFLPNRGLDAYLDDVLPTLKDHDVGPPELGGLGQIHLFPLFRRHLGCPMLRVPDDDLVFFSTS